MSSVKDRRRPWEVAEVKWDVEEKEISVECSHVKPALVDLFREGLISVLDGMMS